MLDAMDRKLDDRIFIRWDTFTLLYRFISNITLRKSRKFCEMVGIHIEAAGNLGWRMAKDNIDVELINISLITRSWFP